MRFLMIGTFALALAMPLMAQAEERTECVLRSELESEATAFVENVSKQAEQERGVTVSQAAKDNLRQMVIEVVGESYKVVDAESDCPAGMKILHSGETKD